MKKYIAILLCLLMVTSLFSCSIWNKSNDTESDTSDAEMPEKDNGTTDISVDDTNKQYYKIEEIGLAKVRYYIYDSDGNIVLSDETDRPLDISMLGDNIVDICIGMGTGISIHKYYDVQNNRFSEEYSYVAAASGNLVAYIDTSMENPMTNRVLVVRDIFDKNTFYKSFGLDFSPTVHDPIESAVFTEDESELEVVYLSERPPVSLSITIPIRRAAGEGEILSHAERAMQAYEAALNDEICVIDEHLGEIKLKACRFPSDNLRLDECKILNKAILDMDGDGINEYVIQSPDKDHIVLHYYGGKVLSYCFDKNNFYNLNADGSYSWNYTGSDFEYGENQIYFEGSALKTREIWRIVNDGEPDAEYYIGDKQVTKEDILKYIEDNPKTRIEFSSLEVSWQKNITNEEALQIASEYWEIEDGFTDYGVGSMWVYRILILDSPSSAFGYYHIGLQVDHYGKDRNDRRILLESKMEYLFVNAATGECQDYASIYGGK